MKNHSYSAEAERHERKIREFLAKEPLCLTNLPEEQMVLFRTAFTHDTFSNEAKDSPEAYQIESYQRLEFLGDAILEFIACEDVYLNSDLNEGEMTKFKQEIVANSKISSKVKSRFDFDDLLLLGNNYRDPKSPQFEEISDNMRADAFEAFIGAMYISFGMERTKVFVKRILW